MAKYKDQKFKAMGITPKEGFTWNPVSRYPVNKPCYCGSQEKAKNCCLPFISKVVSVEFALDIKEAWEKILSGEIILPRASENQ